CRTRRLECSPRSRRSREGVISHRAHRSPIPVAVCTLAGSLLLLYAGCGGSAFSPTAGPSPPPAPGLTAEDVRRVITQAAAEAQAAGLRATIAVTDAEGNVLGVFRMTGAPLTSRVPGTRGQGLQGTDLPTDLAAIAKAATGALLSSGGNAFSTRTASFIVQQNFPPGVDSTPGGPLFGVHFWCPHCGAFTTPGSPLGLSGDPGGTPLYRNGLVVGGVGVEGDGVYGVDTDPADFDAPAEERAALGGARGFDAPDLVRADQILADGIRLPFANAVPQGVTNVAPVPGLDLVPPRTAPPSALPPP